MTRKLKINQDQTKLLGVIIDKDLITADHISGVLTKFSSGKGSEDAPENVYPELL